MGRAPARAIPTAVPTIPDSFKGVSMTRSSPNRAWRPSVIRNTPPETPMSSPRTMVSSWRSIAWWRAALIAWAIVHFSVGPETASSRPTDHTSSAVKAVSSSPWARCMACNWSTTWAGTRAKAWRTTSARSGSGRASISVMAASTSSAVSMATFSPATSSHSSRPARNRSRRRIGSRRRHISSSSAGR